MRTSSWIVFNSFLNTLPLSEKEAHLKLLDPQDQDTVRSLSPPFKNPSEGWESVKEELGRIHISWITAFLRTLPQKEIQLFCSCLTETPWIEIKKALLLSFEKIELSPEATIFLQTELLKKLQEQEPDLLPVCCLPNSPLNGLLELTPPLLDVLIRFLGLHDLSVEMKQIIDTAQLKKIYAALSETEGNYLRVLIQSPEPVLFRPMGVVNWKGEKEVLSALLTQRGLNRLSKGLNGQHRSLLWHLTHMLDTQSAALFQKLHTELDSTSATTALSAQILELISFLRQNHE